MIIFNDHLIQIPFLWKMFKPGIEGKQHAALPLHPCLDHTSSSSSHKWALIIKLKHKLTPLKKPHANNVGRSKQVHSHWLVYHCMNWEVLQSSQKSGHALKNANSTTNAVMQENKKKISWEKKSVWMSNYIDGWTIKFTTDDGKLIQNLNKDDLPFHHNDSADEYNVRKAEAEENRRIAKWWCQSQRRCRQWRGPRIMWWQSWG